MSDQSQPITKRPLPEDKINELNEAWAQSDQLPAGDREGFRNFLRSTYEKHLQEYDPPIDKNNTGLNWMLRKGLEAVDYGPGLVRTGIVGKLFNTLGNGTSDKQYDKDIDDALNPVDGRPAPSGDEYLKREGFGTGPSLSDIPGMDKIYTQPGHQEESYLPKKGGALDPTARGAAGFALDVAPTLGMSLLGKLARGGIGMIAPRSFLSLESQKLADMTAKETAEYFKQKAINNAGLRAKIQKALGVVYDPASAITQKTGDTIYAGAFRDADNAARQAANEGVAELPSNVLKKNKVYGTAKSVEQQTKDLIDNLSSGTDATIDQVGQARPDIQTFLPDADQLTYDRIMEKAAKPGYKDAADAAAQKLKAEIEPYTSRLTDPNDLSQLNIPLKEANQIRKVNQQKARLMGAYNDQPVTAGRASGAADSALEGRFMGEGYRDRAQGFRRSVEDGLDQYQPGLGGEFYRDNRDLGALLGSEKSISQAADASPAQFVKDSMGPAAGTAMAAMASPWGGHGVMAGLTGAGLGMAGSSTLGRTALGLNLSRFAPYIGNGGRSLLLHQYGDEMRQDSPWTLLGKDMGVLDPEDGQHYYPEPYKQQNGQQ